DKDAVVAVMALCEAAAYYRSQGFTLWDQMQNIYQKYGYYVEDLESVTLQGADGSSKIIAIMERFRGEIPSVLGGLKVLAVRDYKTSLRRDMESGLTEPITLPKSDVLYFELENNGWCCVRPSGTEPKIKFYFGAKSSSRENTNEILLRIKEDILKTIN
ncbi:MAG: phospho-sugar mutase, partial [Clostridiales bacterium]|nr:phospho-sugar mutase [Clostridiales bacterium]